jgi:hypothetical protein
MTSDEIIRMALEAGFVTDEADFIYPPKPPRRGIGLEIERVIVLAAAAEREACAKACEAEGERFKHHPSGRRDFSICAAAIRARGEQEQPR